MGFITRMETLGPKQMLHPTMSREIGPTLTIIERGLIFGIIRARVGN